MNAEEMVRAAIPIFVQNAAFNLEPIRVGLIIARLKRPDVERVIEFVPLAFGRSLLDGMGIQFEDYYIRLDRDGNERLRRDLKDEPIFEAALKLAPIVMQQLGQDAFMSIAMRSSELQATNEALNHGASPAGLQASPPVMQWYEGADGATAAPSTKPWWKFW